MINAVRDVLKVLASKVDAFLAFLVIVLAAGLLAMVKGVPLQAVAVLVGLVTGPAIGRELLRERRAERQAERRAEERLAKAKAPLDAPSRLITPPAP